MRPWRAPTPAPEAAARAGQERSGLPQQVGLLGLGFWSCSVSRLYQPRNRVLLKPRQSADLIAEAAQATLIRCEVELTSQVPEAIDQAYY